MPFDAGEGDGVEPHTIDRLLAHVRNPDRDLRRRALETLYDGARARTPTRSRTATTRWSATASRWTGCAATPAPMEATHLRNELPGPVVEQMLDAVERHYALAHRWFRVKAGILGLDRLELHDQYAPDRRGPRRWTTPRPGGLIDDSFGRFSPRVAEIAGGFFDERRIDAEPRAGKRGGAFCAPVAQDASPYILMNFTDRMDDVMTLAHELGHGMHFTLAAGAADRAVVPAPGWRWPRCPRRSPSCSPSTT